MISKRHSYLATSLFVASLLAGPAFAQSAGSKNVEAQPSPAVSGFVGEFLDFLDALDLTDSQRAEIKAILRSHSRTLIPILQQEAQAREALFAAIHHVPMENTALERGARAAAAADNLLALERARIFSEIYPVLSEEQRGVVAAFLEKIRGIILERASDIRGRIEAAIMTGQPLPALGNLGLTEAQKQALKEIYTRHEPEIEDILAREKSARTDLVAAIRRPVANLAAVSAASASVATVDRDLAFLRAQIWNEAALVFTPAQHEKISATRDRVHTLLASGRKALTVFILDLLY